MIGLDLFILRHWAMEFWIWTWPWELGWGLELELLSGHQHHNDCLGIKKYLTTFSLVTLYNDG